MACAVLAVVFLGSEGKPYYLFGLYPVLLAAGAAPTWAWARRTARNTRSLVLALVLSVAFSAVQFLAVLPAGWLRSTPILDVNDAGETVGWPEPAATVAVIRAAVPADERVACWPRTTGRPGPSTGSYPNWLLPTAAGSPTGPGAHRRRKHTP